MPSALRKLSSYTLKTAVLSPYDLPHFVKDELET